MTTKVSEPKPSKDGPWTTRVVKRDRKFYGELRSYNRGRLNVYWAHRRTDEYFRADESWAIDVDTINVLKAYRVTHVGILVEDGTKLLAPIELFGPDGKLRGVTVRNYSKHVGAKGKTGELQWYVPEKLFVMRRPPEDLREETLIERMHIAKGRR
jgi:hypothetical protein